MGSRSLMPSVAHRVPVGVEGQGAGPQSLYASVLLDLMTLGVGHDHEDDVQDAIVSLLRLGSEKEQIESRDFVSVRVLARAILRRRRIDRLRRRLPVLLGEQDVEIIGQEGSAGEWPPLPDDLRKCMGAKAVDLLRARLEGCRSASSLAFRFGVDTRCIRRRVKRLQLALGLYLERHAKELSADDPPQND